MVFNADKFELFLVGLIHELIEYTLYFTDNPGDLIEAKKSI